MLEIFEIPIPGIQVGPSTNHSRSVTGEFYDELAIIVPGDMTGGIPIDKLLTTAFMAALTFRVERAPTGSKIYWRINPIISSWSEIPNDPDVRYKIYARFLISAKPELETQNA